MFRAYDATRERLVAVKLFKLDLPPEKAHQLVAEFERLIAADLKHPALAAPLVTGISGVSAFLAQDYVAADSLDLAVREYGPAPANNALRVAAQLAGALDYAAAVHITHGALHPRDVLLSSDDTRLTGLGVSCALERIGVVAPVRRPYTAPERIAGGEWDRRADVFSLAALMHELMWGRRVSGVGPRAVERLAEIPGADLAGLQAVFARALAENPGDRFATALEFVEALQAACPDIAMAPEPEPPATRRLAREEEPRLPLESSSVVDEPAPSEEVQAFRPAEPVARQTVQPPEPDAELNVRTAPDVAQDFRGADRTIAPLPIAAPEIAYQPAAQMEQAVVSDPPARVTAGVITGHDAEPMSALEVSRTAVWPLVLALGVGMAIGFAGGFFAGSRAQTPAPPATIAAAAPAPAGKEFTEASVPAAAPGPPAANSELKTPDSELKTQNSEAKTQSSEPPKNLSSDTSDLKPETGDLKSETSNLKSETSNLKSPAVPSADGRLLVRSRPEGARVSVDGKDRGVTPATVRDLARGAHRVRITREGYAPEERRIVVTPSRPSQSMTVALEPARAAAPSRAQAATAPPARFTGALAVDSRPTGAKVFMDGQLVGTTPMSLPSVSAGSHAIRLDHDGYRRWSSSVRVVAGEQNRVTASLER